MHDGNPVLKWAASNAVAIEDPAGNIKLDKSKAKFRIDPIIALVVSHVRAMFGDPSIKLEEYILSDDFGF